MLRRLNKGIFLDRDGVINKNEHYESGDPRGYVLGWEDFGFYPNVKEAFYNMYASSYKVFVVSNQSGISRNLSHGGKPVTYKTIEKIFFTMDYELTEYVKRRIYLASDPANGVYCLPIPEHTDRPPVRNDDLTIDHKFKVISECLFCPHDDSYNCNCRKPKPGMIHYLAYKYGIDLSRSWMIGDSQKDMLAGYNAGMRNLILIDEEAEPFVNLEAVPNFGKQLSNRPTMRSLYDAVMFIMAKTAGGYEL